MSIVPPGAKLRASMRGTRFWNCTLLPVLTLTTSKIFFASSPAFLPNTIASAIATVAIWPSMLLISFIARPWPRSADMEHVLAHRMEEILARGEGLGRPADDHRQRPRRRAVRAAADRRVEHRDAFLRQLLRKCAAPRADRSCSCRARCRPASPLERYRSRRGSRLRPERWSRPCRSCDGTRAAAAG